MKYITLLIFAGESTEWLVPITVSTSASPDSAVQSVLMDSPSLTVTLDNVTPDSWVKVRMASTNHCLDVC